MDEGKEKNCIVLGDTDSEAEEDDEVSSSCIPVRGFVEADVPSCTGNTPAGAHGGRNYRRL